MGSEGKRWEPVLWRSNDEDVKKKIIALLGDEYGELDVTSPDYYDWQYRKNPNGEPVYKMAMGLDGRLAGQYVLIPIQLAIEGNIQNGTLSVLTLTKEEYRGQGIFIDLARDAYEESAKRGFKFVLGFPNQNSYRGFVGKLEFADLGELRLMLKLMKPSRLIESRVGGIWGRMLGKLGAPADVFFSCSKEELKNIVRIFHFNGSFNEFDKILTERFAVHQLRTSAFLNWRFIENPRRYLCYGWYDGRKLRGYVVLTKKIVSGYSSGMIVDFFVDNGLDSVVVGMDLVRTALQEFSTMDVHLVGSLVNASTIEYKILRKCGFFVSPKFLSPQPFSVIFRRTVKGWGEGLPITSLEGWALSMGDYEAA